MVVLSSPNFAQLQRASIGAKKDGFPVLRPLASTWNTFKVLLQWSSSYVAGLSVECCWIMLHEASHGLLLQSIKCIWGIPMDCANLASEVLLVYPG